MLESFGRMLSKTGQSAVKKTKDITEEMRLNSSISDLERKLNKLMNQLGKAYYDKYAASPLQEFSEIVQTISNIDNTIQEHREQIRKLKNLTVCSGCGMEMPYDSLFCARCGKPVKRQEASGESGVDQHKCLACGAALLTGAMFCNSCGLRLDAADEPKHETVRCTSCGAELLRGAPFCHSCGARLGEAGNTGRVNAEQEAVQWQAQWEPEFEEDDIDIALMPQPAPAEPAYEEAADIRREVCALCGAELFPGALFCLKCGATIEHSPAPAQEDVCLHCGAALMPGAEYCLSCGNAVAEAEAPSSQSGFCVQCNEKLIPGSMFCLNCGKKV